MWRIKKGEDTAETWYSMTLGCNNDERKGRRMSILRWVPLNDHVTRANIACNFYLDVIQEEAEDKKEWYWCLMEHTEEGYVPVLKAQKIWTTSSVPTIQRKAALSANSYIAYRRSLLDQVFRVLEEETR